MTPVPDLGDLKKLYCYFSPSSGHRIVEYGFKNYIVRCDTTTGEDSLVPRLFPLGGK